MDITQLSKEYTNKEGTKIVTNYKDAVNWLNNSYVLCNRIGDMNIDESIFDNARFEYLDEDTDEYTEIYQWFITDASESDIEYLEKRFGLLFTYSDLLDTYVLCVDHLGTSWDYVGCDDSEKDEYFKNQIKGAK